MPHGDHLHVTGLTKTFGRRRPVHAVQDLTFEVASGRVTGFLGPNGSGKTTTLRCLLGLVTPTSGVTSIGATPYRSLHHPLHVVGAALEASGFHPARSARNHLRIIAASGHIPDSRVDDVLGIVGLADAAGRRVGGYSLGMRQRLALAAALLGDPGVLILDEPANGLDPEGIAWLRSFLRNLAAEGRTILVSSHVLSEVQQTVDDVVVITHGRLVHVGPLDALTAAAEVRVRTPQRDALMAALADKCTARVADHDALTITGLTPAEVGTIAFRAAIELHELSATTSDLEEAFLARTSTINNGSAA